MEDFDESEYVAKEHDILISAVSKLDKTQHITEPTRSEPSIANSEFNLLKRSLKLDLKNVARVLEETTSHSQISKKLKKSYDSSKVLSKPLEKPQAQRIKRATGYEDTKKKVGRWDPVVARSRTAEYAVFPLKPVETKLQPTNEYLARFELKSELEKELEEVDPPPHKEEEEEEEKIYPMSYEEMLEHRQHLAKLRAQQSYKEAKAKRQSKIKSKKYHRVLKKERLKQQLKEFEELQRTNPEEALKKLEAIDKGRALERHTLRHKNTGKWAKNKLIRAKYDKDVRQQLAEQLAVSRNLTQKTKFLESSDDEDSNDNNIINKDIALSQDPTNPWMLKESNKSNVNSEFDFGYKKYLKEKMLKPKEDSESDGDNDTKGNNDEVNINATDLLILKHSINRITQNSNGPSINHYVKDDKSNKDTIVNNLHNNKQSDPIIMDTKTDQSNEQYKKNGNKQATLKKNHDITPEKTKIKSKTKNKNTVIATSVWTVEPIDEPMRTNGSLDISTAFESLENKVVGKVEKKLKRLRKQIARLEKDATEPKMKSQKKADDPEIDNLEYLKLKNQKQRAIIDEALTETGTKDIDNLPNVDAINPSKVLNTPLDKKQNTATSDIDPNRFIEVKPKYLNTAIPKGNNDTDLLDDDEQVVPKVNIEDVFEEDDVVACFRQEKDDEINKDKPEDIDLSLPGWGSWGGRGVKAPKRKKHRIIIKEAPKMPRRDENKGDIIIKEYRDPKLIVHKVKEVPFPFTSVKDFEASIRAPLGNTFIPEKAHKKLIRPSVITKAGTIIEAMDEDELLVKKNRNFMNQGVLKILGQK